MQLAASTTIKKLQNCVKKVAHSLTAYNRGDCLVYFLPNLRTNLFKFYGLRANRLTVDEGSAL